MDTIKLPTGLATSLLEDKFRSLKGKSLTALTKQILVLRKGDSVLCFKNAF